MNRPLAFAALLMAGTTALHVLGGGPQVHQALLTVADSAELGLYVSLLWHFVTLFLGFAALAFVLAARDRTRWGGMALASAILTLGMAALFFTYGWTRLGEPLTAPQWVLLAPIALLAMWPLRRA